MPLSLVLLIAALGTWTVLILVSPALGFDVVWPRARVPLETIGAVVASLTAGVAYVWYSVTGSRRTLFIAAAFAALATNQILSGVVAGSGSFRLFGPERVYFWAAGRLLAVMLLLLAGMPRHRPERVPEHPLAIFAVVGAAVVGTIVATHWLLWTYRSDLPALAGVQAGSLGSIRGSMANLTTADLALGCIAAVLYFAAAFLFLPSHSRVQREPRGSWLSLALVVAGFSHLHYMFFPTVFSDLVSTGDLLRLAFYAMLFVGMLWEVRFVYDSEHAARLELERMSGVERRVAERALRDAKERFASAFDNAPIGFALTELDGRFLQVNRAFRRMTGYSEEQLLATGPRTLLYPDDVDADEAYLEQMLSGEMGNYQMERRYRHADGHLIWVLASTSLIRDSEGRPMHYILQAEDVSERKQAEEELVHRSLHDALTELPNRMLFMDRLDQALRRTPRRPGSVAVLFLDLDHFKVINDSLGHEVGDKVLRVSAERIQGALRPGDTASRFGGDEFVILCEDIRDEGHAMQIADRLAEVIAHPMPLEGTDVVVTTSVGIAMPAASGEQPQALVRDADAALYRAKGRGRARSEIFDSEMRVRAVRRMQTENELRRAIGRRELSVHYQPIVDVRTGGISAVEALVRWKHPRRGLLLPPEFISVAEETGLIEALGSWVLGEACSQHVAWCVANATQSAPTMSVNVSARELAKDGFVDRVASVLDGAGMDPQKLCLEITETVLMEAARSSLSALEELRGLGISLAIDDFGTGYSSLTYLKRFHVDSLKVDRSFIDGLGRDPEDTAIVTAVVALAHALGLTIVGEGVESLEQLDRLAQLGCDEAQGVYLAAPAPAAVIGPLLPAVLVRNPVGDPAA